jgi:hypothetical protein
MSAVQVRDRDDGETLVEGIVAIGIMGVVLVALVGLVGTAISLGTVRDAQARSEAVVRSVYESVIAYRAPIGGALTCADTAVIADITRIVTAAPMPDGVTVSTPSVFERYLPATSTTPVPAISSVPCPSSSAPPGAVPLGLAVSVRVTASGSGRGGQSWSDSMTALVGRSL